MIDGPPETALMTASLTRWIRERSCSMARSRAFIASTFSEATREPVRGVWCGAMPRSMHGACHALRLRSGQALQSVDRLRQRPLLAQHVGPEVAGLLDPRRHVRERESAGIDRALFDLLPRARRRHRRAALRAHGVGRRERRAIAVAAGVDVDPAVAI